MPSDSTPEVREAQREMLSGVPAMSPIPPDEGPGIVANSAYNIAGRLVGGGISALSGFLTLRILGPGPAGVLAVIFGMVELGRGLTNFVHNPSIMRVHQGRDATRVFGTSLSLKLLGAATLILALAAAGPWLSAWFDIPYVALLLASLVMLIGVFFEVGAARLEAENRMAVSNLILASGPVVGLAGILAFALMGNLNVYTSILATLLANLTMSAGFLVAWRGPLRVGWDREEASFFVRYGSRLVLSTFLTTALVWTDTLMVSYLRGNYETGIYQAAFNLSFMMVSLSVAIGVALVPAISRLAGRGHDTDLAYQRATVVALILSVGMALLYVLLGKWLLWLAGEEFVAGYPPLLVLTLFGVAAALAVPASSMLTVHGHANWLIVLGAGQLAVNVVVNFLFIREWGILGAAWATTLVFIGGTLVSWVLVRRSVGAWPLSRQVFVELRQGVLHRR